MGEGAIVTRGESEVSLNPALLSTDVRALESALADLLTAAAADKA